MSLDGAEYVLTTCNDTQETSVFLNDFIPDVGNIIIKTYKNGGVAAHNTLQQIGKDFILIAEQNEPLLHMWPLNSEQPSKDVKLTLPEPACALAVSPNNHFLAAGIGSKLYIWHLNSGSLLSVQERHVLPITCIKFSEDNVFLVTACQAGMLSTYWFDKLISAKNRATGLVFPLYTIKDHSAAIVGLHVGNFEMDSDFMTVSNGCFVTISNDHTCRLYCLDTGRCFLHLLFNEQLTSVIFDTPCWNLYIGTDSGVIYHVKLQVPPRTMIVHADMEENCILKFEGHKGRITCLDLNITNEILVSGSDDTSVILWNISSRQQLHRITQSGGITNVKSLTNIENLSVENIVPKFKVASLKPNIELQPENTEISILPGDINQLQKQFYDLNITNEGCHDKDKDSEDVIQLQNQLYDLNITNEEFHRALSALNRNVNY